jgi:DNA (cytosine-5)-methyltransferase 1
VAQRRRRVFVVGHFGDRERAAKVLFESESVRRDSPPSREARQGIAAGIESSFDERGLQRTIGTLCADTHPGAYSGQDAYSGRLVPYVFSNDPVTAICANEQRTYTNEGSIFQLRNVVAQPVHFRKSRRAQSVNDHETWVEDAVSNTLNCFDVGDVRSTDVVAQPVAFAQNQLGEVRVGEVTNTLNTNSNASGRNTPMVAQPYVGGVDYENNAHTMDEPTGPLLKGSPTGGGRPLPAIATAMQVRRLTPVECERLQGFPDGYTNIPWRKAQESPDGPRYKALGNSMAVPVMRWIGERINKVDNE